MYLTQNQSQTIGPLSSAKVVTAGPVGSYAKDRNQMVTVRRMVSNKGG